LKQENIHSYPLSVINWVRDTSFGIKIVTAVIDHISNKVTRMRMESARLKTKNMIMPIYVKDKNMWKW
jgi:hypothetical protein